MPLATLIKTFDRLMECYAEMVQPVHNVINLLQSSLY